MSDLTGNLMVFSRCCFCQRNMIRNELVAKVFMKVYHVMLCKGISQYFVHLSTFYITRIVTDKNLSDKN